MTKSLLSLILFATIYLFGGAPNSYAQIAWPKDVEPLPVIKAQITARPLRDKFYLGASVPFEICLTNLADQGDEPRFGDIDLRLRQIMFDVRVTGPDGKLCRGGIRNRWVQGWLNMESPSGFPLKRGESATTIFQLERRANFSQPGKHQVEISFNPQQRLTLDSPPLKTSFTIDLQNPTVEEAERIFEDAVKASAQRRNDGNAKRPSSEHTIANSLPWSIDVFTGPEPFSFEPYLPVLLRHFDKGNMKFNRSLQEIGTLESGRALAARLKAAPADIVAEMLSRAIPSEHNWSFFAAPAVWSDEFKAPLLEYARQRLASDNYEARKTAVYILKYLGNRSDLLPAMQLLEKRLKATSENPERDLMRGGLTPEKDRYEAGQECRELIPCCQQLIQRGAKAPTQDTFQGAAADFPYLAERALKLAVPERILGPVPSVSPTTVEEGVRHSVPFIRYLALHHFMVAYPENSPVPAAIRDRLPDLLRDPDESVRYEASVLRERLKKEQV